MDIGVISVRYARALLKTTMEFNNSEDVYKEMQRLAQSYIEVPDLRHTIDNPMLAKETKRQLLSTASGGACELTLRFFDIVLREDRADMIQFMANSYITLYRKQNNIIRGKLTTAVPVSVDVKSKMQRMVENMTNGTVEFETEVDADIMGGFVLEYDTYRMDASVKNRLREILQQLKN